MGVLTTQDSDQFARRRLDSPLSLVKIYWRPLTSSALSWFLYDIVEYGLKNNQVKILSDTTSIHNSLLESMLTGLITLVFIFAASMAVSMAPNKWCQLGGFTMLMVVNLTIACSYHEGGDRSVFLCFYILQSGFQAFPGVTTLAIPAEVFPNQVRGTCHGVSAVAGKLGALFGTEYFAVIKSDGYDGLFHESPYKFIFSIVASACFLGTIVTTLLTPKYDGSTLDRMEIATQGGGEHSDHRMALAILYGKTDGLAEQDNASLNAAQAAH